MPRRIEKRERGVYEKEPGSDIWWIRYKVDGVLHREKVGRRGDAIKLYKVRKTDALRGVKLPVNLKQRGIRFRVIGDEAVAWYENHGQKDLRTFKLRMDMILRDFANRLVEEIKPSDIDAWLGNHDWAPATKNRYKSVFSKAFKLALADGKVSGNPARLVEQRPEKNGRKRFLSAEEEKKLREAIEKRCPHHMPELDIALHTGMRKGEQYSLEWPQVSFRRKRILLEETKNGSSREVPMNKSCIAALELLHQKREHDGRVCQSKFNKDLNDSRAWFDRCIEDAKISNFNALKGDGKTYEQRTLVASSSQVAQLVFSYVKGSQALGNQLDLFSEATDISSEASSISVEIANFKGNASFHFYSNQALFLEESAKAQRVVSDLNKLSSDLTASAFLARAVTLSSNFAYLETILSAVYERLQYDRSCPAVASTITKDSFGDIEACAPHEAQTLQAFLSSIDNSLQYYEPGAAQAGTFLSSAAPAQIATKIANLRQNLDNARTSSQTLFTAMNDWYTRSSVQDIKTLPSLQTNASIQVSLAVRRNYVPFQFGPPPATATTASTAAPPFQPIVNSLLIEVHRKVYFNVVGGALAFHIPSSTYAFQPCKDGSGNAGFCPYQTDTSKFQVEGLAAVVWNPWGRDYFPYGSTQSVGLDRWHRLVPGLMLGTSVTSLGNAFGGVNVEPTNGINLYIGAANGTSTVLAPGVTPSTFFTDDKYLPTVTSQRIGFAFGVGLDYTVFCSIFKKGCGS